VRYRVLGRANRFRYWRSLRPCLALADRTPSASIIVTRAPAPPPVAARGLVKRYGDLVAVDHVDLTIDQGDVFGYLGPNGAGKTTSLRMLLGLIRPTEGTVRLFGRDPLLDGARALDGVAGFVEGPRFYPYLSGQRNLQLLADYDDAPTSRIPEVLDVVELRDRAKDRVGGYSHGMRQRLGIAAALLRSLRLPLLDEPTTGLDPAGMRDMRDLVRRLAGEGITVLLSSHLLGEVEELCNRVAIIQKGRVVYEGSLRELLAGAASGYRLRSPEPARARAVCLAQTGIEQVTSVDGEVRFQADEESVGALSIALGQARIAVTALVPETASLEELFLDLTEGHVEEAVA
jgi:ABC-2 type transport system ATP-binding protein